MKVTHINGKDLKPPKTLRCPHEGCGHTYSLKDATIDNIIKHLQNNHPKVYWEWLTS